MSEINNIDWHSILRYEEGFLYWRIDIGQKVKAGDFAGADNDGYIQISYDGRRYKAHRIVWIMFYGNIDDAVFIDHIDGVGYNNNIENLRLATHSENMRNRSKRVNSENRYKGVSKCSNSSNFVAAIWHDGVKIGIGQFSNDTAAAKAYNIKAIELFGTFAKLNTIEEEIGNHMDYIIKHKRFSDDDIRAIRKRSRLGGSNQRIANSFSCDSGSISQIVLGKSYRSVL